jgi:hypothetical protein
VDRSWVSQRLRDLTGCPACHPSQKRQWYGWTVPPPRRTRLRAASRASPRDAILILPRHERCSNQVGARFIADATTTPSIISVPFPFQRSGRPPSGVNIGPRRDTFDVTAGALRQRVIVAQGPNGLS